MAESSLLDADPVLFESASYWECRRRARELRARWCADILDRAGLDPGGATVTAYDTRIVVSSTRPSWRPLALATSSPATVRWTGEEWRSAP